MTAPDDFGKVASHALGMEYIPDNSAAENKEDALAQAVPLLAAGRSVLTDMRYNTPDARSKGPIAVAREAGARSVAIIIDAPQKLIVSRYEHWPRKGFMSLTAEQQRLSPYERAEEAMRGVIKPLFHERLGLIIGLPGGHSAVFLSRKIGKVLAHPQLDGR